MAHLAGITKTSVSELGGPELTQRVVENDTPTHSTPTESNGHG